jgi:uncharacterized circularly permuted ATP-grasp superfamily protein
MGAMQSQSQSQGNGSQRQSQRQGPPPSRVGLFRSYEENNFYDEMFDADGYPREHYRGLFDQLSAMTPTISMRVAVAPTSRSCSKGITFTVYGGESGGNTERIFPFDLVPRIITARKWDRIERGLKQRIHALNLFLHDIYHDQKILKDGVVPMDLILGCPDYRREIFGVDVVKDVYINICGTDLVRDANGEYIVLEDNLRSPSGACYVLENRQVMKNTFPNTFERYNVRSVDAYCLDLRDNLRAVAPAGIENPTIVLLTPGIYNAAYYDHAFLAKQMGIELCEGSDLVVDDAHVYMRTTEGLRRVDVIYRRVDDDFLDPMTFRPDSSLGVTGLVNLLACGQCLSGQRHWNRRRG